MRFWIYKAVLQKLLSVLPFGYKINFLFQKYVTKGLTFNRRLFADKVTHLVDHFNTFYSSGKSLADCRVLEVGTGWHPVVPVGLFLAGFNSIHTIDVYRHLRKNSIFETLKAYRHPESFLDSDSSASLLATYQPDRFKTISFILEHFDDFSLEDILRHLNIDYSVGSFNDHDFESRFFDLITSNNVLEHIRREDMAPVLCDLKWVLKDDGIMSHFIDLTDHYAHFDKDISPYNFLNFSDSAWSLIDNAIQPMNRFRASDYRRLFKGLGFDIFREFTVYGCHDQLANISLNERFAALPVEDILTTHIHFSLKRSY